MHMEVPVPVISQSVMQLLTSKEKDKTLPKAIAMMGNGLADVLMVQMFILPLIALRFGLATFLRIKTKPAGGILLLYFSSSPIPS